MWFVVIIGGIFGIGFAIQRIFYIYAERKISKFLPLLISCTGLILCYVAYRIEKYKMFNSEKIYTSMAIDIVDIGYYFLGMIILIALAGCIFGLIAGMIRNKKILAESRNEKIEKK